MPSEAPATMNAMHHLRHQPRSTDQKKKPHKKLAKTNSVEYASNEPVTLNPGIANWSKFVGLPMHFLLLVSIPYMFNQTDKYTFFFSLFFTHPNDRLLHIVNFFLIFFLKKIRRIPLLVTTIWFSLM